MLGRARVEVTCRNRAIGRSSKQTTFFAQEFEAPAWRARWVERM